MRLLTLPSLPAPKYVFFTDTFPKTASGKIQKFALREQSEKLVSEGKGME